VGRATPGLKEGHQFERNEGGRENRIETSRPGISKAAREGREGRGRERRRGGRKVGSESDKKTSPDSLGDGEKEGLVRRSLAGGCRRSRGGRREKNQRELKTTDQVLRNHDRQVFMETGRLSRRKRDSSHDKETGRTTYGRLRKECPRGATAKILVGQLKRSPGNKTRP